MPELQAGYHVVEQDLASKWWSEEGRTGGQAQVLSLGEFLRRLQRGEKLEGYELYVVGLGYLFEVAEDRGGLGTWIHGILERGHNLVRGKVVKVVVPRMVHEQPPKMVIKRQRGQEEVFPLVLIFGSLRLEEPGHAYATYTVS